MSKQLALKKWLGGLAAFGGLGLLAYELNKAAEPTGKITMNTPPRDPSAPRKSSEPKEPRGIRNNNPGNIKITRPPTQWEGLAPLQTDPVFVQFKSPVYGIRAMARIIKNYQSRYKLKTIKQIISRWAPSTENHTKAYTDFVARQLVKPPLNINHNQIITPRDYPELIAAIIFFENGKQPYNQRLIEQGIALS